MWYLRYKVNIIFQFSEEVTLELCSSRLSVENWRLKEPRKANAVVINYGDALGIGMFKNYCKF